MKILVDADACPVKDLIEQIAEKYGIEVIMIANINHFITSTYAEVIIVDGHSQAADIAIINRTSSNDIVVTQDYGLASMVLVKGGMAISPTGKLFNNKNIDGLLMQRFVNYKARQAGYKINGPKKRNTNDDQRFINNITRLIEYAKNNNI